MAKCRRLSVGLVEFLFALSMSAPVLAQTTSSAIAGVVKDHSGAVMPGVTVEASSPALIERVRTATTDGQGQYRIVDLRPGTYAVTFSLTGFNTVKREGIELTTGFTAPVNVELSVGALQETVTVSGASPVVDIQNTAQVSVMTRDQADSIPTGKDFHNYLSLIPGMKGVGLDVGGQNGQVYAGMSIHGGSTNDHVMQVDGMSILSMTNIMHSANFVADGAFQEFAFDVSANSAEVETGGVRSNFIPREGSNTFKGGYFTNWSPTSLQSSNLSAEDKARGLTAPAKVSKLWVSNPTIGGPIMRDKLWFFGSYTWSREDKFAANSYYNKDVAAWDYVPDLSRPAINDQYNYDATVRTTWQANQRNKFNFYYSANYTCQCNRSSATTTPEAAFAIVLTNRLYQATWSSPISGRLLLDAGVSSSVQDNHWMQRPESVAPQISDSGKNITYRASNTDQLSSGPVITARASAAYVTGSHNAKVGFTLIDGTWNKALTLVGNLTYAAVNGVPSAVTYTGRPTTSTNFIRPNLGIYAQDQWTYKKRLTTNAGVRFDFMRETYPDQSVPATQFVRSVRSFPGSEVAKWEDLSPRLGVAYDLFGNSKTAVKASANRYVMQQGVEYAVMANPIESNNTNRRQWTDGQNGLPVDRIIQGDPFDPLGNGELGPSQNLSFGRPVITTTYDPAFSHGFANRPANWEFSTGIQHELLPRVSVNASYFRRIYTNFLAYDNALVGPADYDPYCVTAPADARLPASVSGQQVCGLYDLNPIKVGQVQTVGKRSSEFGNQYQHWNGGDLTVNIRRSSLLLQGGLSTGSTMTDTCAVVTGATNASANAGSGPSTRFCRTVTPFLTDVTFLGSYTLPWQEIQVSGTFKNLAGPQLTATATFSNAQVVPSLKRSLSSGSSVAINLVSPGTMYAERQKQLDFRLAKTFRVAHGRLQAMLDLYNALNADQLTSFSSTYGVTTGASTGSAWLVPTGILAPRVVKVGIQANF